MSRSQDTVIDDDEESCPLCIEEFDLSDKNFRPCPCGYQICQFCFNSLKNTYEKSTCPNCRRPYDESTIQYKIPTAEEYKLDQQNKNKKLAAAKRKETEKREVENSSRRNLAGVRVKQQNLVYVIGLEPTKRDESSLMDTLRGKDYFGQYGPIEKIVVSKPKPGAVNQGVGVYVTFKNNEDAATCIECVDGSQNGEKILRAQFGTTKYCSTFLRGETCQNKNCSFLHESGEDGQNSSLQNEPIESKSNRNTMARPTSVLQSSTSSHSMIRQGSGDDSSSRKQSTDTSALPPTAGWANAPVARARRASQVTSTPSPRMTHSALASQKAESPRPVENQSQATSKGSTTSSNETPAPNQVQSPTIKSTTVQTDPTVDIWEALKKGAFANNLAFQYDDSWMSNEERERIAELPLLWDPYGGAKRRLMADKEAEARAKLEADEKTRLEEQATSAAEDALDEDNMAAGSLALGGEPEDNPRSASARGAIGRPSQPASSTGLSSDHFANLTRSLTPQQQRQLGLLTSGNLQQNTRLAQPPAQNTAFEMSDFDRRGPQYSQAQYDQISSHARNGSRYFNSESKSSASRFPGQQQQQQQIQQQQQQPPHPPPFFTSGVQGPPPGLPTAGTPPISGGGMFAHGFGFTSGFGSSKDASTDAIRNRSATNTGHDVKRELLLSLQNNSNPLRSPPTQSSAPGGLNPLYGQYAGAYQDPGLVKQRKKGKKHRHANTSSSGGGVEHLADPSLVTARVHQSGATTGQSLFGGNQGGYNQSNMAYGGNFNRW